MMRVFDPYVIFYHETRREKTGRIRSGTVFHGSIGDGVSRDTAHAKNKHLPGEQVLTFFSFEQRG